MLRPVQLLVGDVFRRAALSTPTGVAASLAGDERTFAEVERQARGLGWALRDAGVGPGDRVAWWGGTSLPAVSLFAAVAKIGAVFVPLSTSLSVEEARPVLTKARARLLLIAAGQAPAAARTLVEACGDARPALGVADLSDLERAGRGRGDDPSDPAVLETDPQVIFFTSGSTGAPKGVVLSHRANCLRTFPPNAPHGRGATVCMFPLFHMASWTIALGCWQVREETAFVLSADAEPLLATAVARRAGRMYLIPAVWDRVLRALEEAPGRWDLSRLREADTGTSATPPELLARIRQALPWTITRVMYGSTEAGPATTLGPEDLERKPGSVGVASVGVEVRLADSGEVEVRSPFLMDGYFEDGDATSAALVDGWYRTGDLGVIDDEGYLSIVGRARDVIRTGGETVAPAEVELVLADVPGIADVAVVGLPDPQWGEVVCAVVVPADGAVAASLSVDSLRRACQSKLAPFKHPRRLHLVDALPRTAATGQVQRALIIERLRVSSADGN